MENETNEIVQDKAKWTRPPALALELQLNIKDDVRRLFHTHTKTQIVELIKNKHKIAQRTAYKYVDKTIVEDFADLKKDNIVMEILASRQFRKKHLLNMYSKIIKKEDDTKELARPYEAPQLKAQLLRQMAEEDKMLVSMMQELNVIEKPAERLETKSTLFIGNILERIQENIKDINIIDVEVSNEKKIHE